MKPNESILFGVLLGALCALSGAQSSLIDRQAWLLAVIISLVQFGVLYVTMYLVRTLIHRAGSLWRPASLGSPVVGGTGYAITGVLTTSGDAMFTLTGPRLPNGLLDDKAAAIPLGFGRTPLIAAESAHASLSKMTQAVADYRDNLKKPE